MSSSAARGNVRLDGKVALITGASSGIGRCAAVTFAKLGAKLSLVGRNSHELEATGKECEAVQADTKPLLVKADLTNDADRERVVKDTIDRFQQLDILVNNAGIYTEGSIETTSLKQFDDVFNINVRAVYHLTMLCVPHLINTQGSIVNVSSINGIRAFPGDLAYCMSKAALDQFTRCVALDLGPKQVRVNSVNPGVIVTDIHRRAGMGEEEYQKFLERSKGNNCLGRLGTVEDVCDTIAFLASSSSSFITGNTVSVDGGRHVMCPR
ncbi:3-oxoacyl-[acyl-carrier-protein] reductase FabG-like [Babylonia areolata]|uniref:3-oxoacyl-[acyl-carrier-protein] reductase FabG-like n=1 Tax=Babylonia areolata TaxID=304850 RepID=UPI003FD539C5